MQARGPAPPETTMFNIERLTKPEILSHTAEIIGTQDETVAELRRQRLALLAIITVLAAMVTF